MMRTYCGFQMTSGNNKLVSKRQLTRFQRIVRGTVSTVVPKNASRGDVDSYVEAYNCCPPPLFIPIISVAEVSTGSQIVCLIFFHI